MARTPILIKLQFEPRISILRHGFEYALLNILIQYVGTTGNTRKIVLPQNAEPSRASYMRGSRKQPLERGVLHEFGWSLELRCAAPARDDSRVSGRLQG